MKGVMPPLHIKFRKKFPTAVLPYLILYISDDHNKPKTVNFGKILGFCNVKAHEFWGPIASYLKGIRVLVLWYSVRGVNMTFHLHVAPRLRMNGAIPLFRLRNFMA
jgi:hypothetical protein